MGSAESECTTVRSHGCDLHLWVSGPSGSPVIAFTHGFGLDHHLFDEQVSALSGDHRVVTWDVRGHGRSQPAGAFSPDVLADDLDQILDATTREPVVLIGQSLGGNIVQHFVWTRPGRVRAVVLIGCARNSVASRRWRTEVTIAHALMRVTPWGRVRREMAKRTAAQSPSREYAYATSGLLDPTDARVMWGALPHFLIRRPYDNEVPTLLVRGTRDRMGGFRRQMQRWARDEGISYVEIPDAGHNANQDNPAAFNHHLRTFLRSLDANA